VIREGDLVSWLDQEEYSIGIVTKVFELDPDWEHGGDGGYYQVQWSSGDRMLDNTQDCDGEQFWYEGTELRLLSRGKYKF